MKRTIVSCLFAWFLIIQSIGMEGKAIGVIPVQDKDYCNRVIQTIKYKGWANVDYYCIDVGKI